MKKALHTLFAILMIFAIVGCDMSMDRLQDQIVPEAPSTAAKTITLTLKLPEGYEVGSNAYYSYNLTSELKDSVNTLTRSNTAVRVETGHEAKVTIANVPEGTWSGYVTIGRSAADASPIRQYVNGLTITSNTYAEAALDFNRTSAPVAEYTYEIGETTVRFNSTATVYYSTDGSDPTREYGTIEKLNGIVLTENATVKAIAVSEETGTSTVYTGNFNVYKNPIAAPTFGPLVFDKNNSATMKLELPEGYKNNDSVYYTTNDSDPKPGDTGVQLYASEQGITYTTGSEVREGTIKVKAFGPANSDGIYTISSDTQTLTVYQPSAPVFAALETVESTSTGIVKAEANTLVPVAEGKSIGIFYSTTDDPINTADRVFVNARNLNEKFEKGTAVFARSAVVTLSSDGPVIHEWSALSTFYTDSIAEIPELGAVVADNAEATSGTIQITVPGSVTGDLYKLYYTLNEQDPMEVASRPNTADLDGNPVTVNVDSANSIINVRIGKFAKVTDNMPIAWSPIASMPVYLVKAPTISEESGENSYTVTITAEDGTSIIYSVNGGGENEYTTPVENVAIGSDYAAYAVRTEGGKVVARSAVAESRIGAPDPADLTDMVLYLNEDGAVAGGNVSIDTVEGVVYKYAISDTEIAEDNAAALTETYEAGDIDIPVGKVLTVAAMINTDNGDVYSRFRSLEARAIEGPSFGLVRMTDDESGSIEVVADFYSVGETPIDPRTGEGRKSESTFTSSDLIMWAYTKVGNVWTVSKTDIVKIKAPVMGEFVINNDNTASQAVSYTAIDDSADYTYEIRYRNNGATPTEQSALAASGTILGESAAYVIDGIQSSADTLAIVFVKEADGNTIAQSATAATTANFGFTNDSYTSSVTGDDDFSDPNSNIRFRMVINAPDGAKGTLYVTSDSSNDLSTEYLRGQDGVISTDSTSLTQEIKVGRLYARFNYKDANDISLGWSKLVELSTYKIGQSLTVDGYSVVVFYVGTYGPNDEYSAMAVLKSDSGTNKELLSYNTGGQFQWGAHGKNVGNTDQSIGAGLANSNAALANSNSFVDKDGTSEGTTIWTKLKDFRANSLESDFEGNRTKWFMPSYEELQEIQTNYNTLITAGVSFSIGNYWSSSENDASGAMYVNISSSANGATAKTNNYYVRFCRAL